MTAKNLVSVIMPAYNTEKYIAAAIESIIAQNYKNWELLIVDDCSTDGTAAIAESYAKKDKRIRLIHNKENSKQWFSRNVGLAAARGDYIAWMDSDDISTPDRLEKQMTFLAKNKDIDMVGSFCNYMDTEGKIVVVPNYKGLEEFFSREYHLNKRGLNPACYCATFCFSKKILDKINQPYFRPLAVGEDTDFLFRLMEKEVQIVNMPDRLYYYRTHGSQTTKDSFSEILYGLLVRYGAYCRQRFGADPLDEVIKNYRTINRQYLTSGVIKIFKDNVPEIDEMIISQVNKKFYFQTDYLRLLFAMMYHRPSTILSTPATMLYLAMPFMHRPWRGFKKIIGVSRGN